MNHSEIVIKSLEEHQQALSECSRCENMIQPVITGNTVNSSIMTVGQAPGIHEGRVQKPFGWTAGKTLFKWFSTIGVEEEDFRQQVYMAAVCRCFPGKNPKGSGDRVPDKQEIATCKSWIEEEYKILQPKLIIPIGKLAISQYLPHKKLSDVVGQQFVIDTPLLQADCIPLPHPSGLSTWFNTEPGKTLLQEALAQIDQHKAWQEVKNSIC